MRSFLSSSVLLLPQFAKADRKHQNIGLGRERNSLWIEGDNNISLSLKHPYASYMAY